MLLQRLVQYAQNHSEDVPPLYYKEAQVRWLIRLTADGQPDPPHLIPDRDPTDDRGLRGFPRLVPTVARSGIASKPYLAADQIKYVLGWITGDDVTDKTARLTPRHHGAFRALVDEWAADAVEDPIASAVARFYRDGHSSALPQPEDAWTDSDLVAFSVDGQIAHTTSSAQRFWARQCLAAKGSGIEGVCLCCGQVGPLLKTVPTQLAGRLLPGAGTQGQALVSMNKLPHGFDLKTGLTNTPICEICGVTAVAGLESLLGNRNQLLKRKGQQGATVWWVTKAEDVSFFDLLNKPDEAQVAALISSPAAGRQSAAEPDSSAFCSLTVSGSTARVVVRDWVDIPLLSVVSNIATWFDHHGIIDSYTGEIRHLPIGQLALCAGRYDAHAKGTGSYTDFGSRGEQRPGDLYSALLRSAIQGDPMPPALLAHLVTRIRTDRHLDTARAALLRLCLVRHPSGGPVTSALDPDARDVAYLCGRAFALLEATQDATTRGKEQRNTTFADRYLSKAITNPAAALVAGRRDAVAWFRKLRTSNGGAHYGLNKDLDQVFGHLSEIPVALTLREQARFLLGYHQQRAHRRNRTPDTGESNLRLADQATIEENAQ